MKDLLCHEGGELAGRAIASGKIGEYKKLWEKALVNGFH